MCMMRKSFVWKLIFFLGLSGVFGMPIPIFSEEKDARNGKNFLKKESVISFKTDVPRLLPESLQSDSFRSSLKRFKPIILIEQLYTMPRPPLRAGEDPMSFIMKRLIDLPSLKGLLYYSSSRDRFIVFIKDSFFTKDSRFPFRPEELPRIGETPLPYLQRGVLLKTGQLGNILFRVTSRITGQTMRLSLRNRTTVKFLFFHVVPQDRMEMDILLKLEKDHLLVYLNTAVGKVLWAPPGRLAGSINTRMHALQTWISDRLFPEGLPPETSVKPPVSPSPGEEPSGSDLRKSDPKNPEGKISEPKQPEQEQPGQKQEKREAETKVSLLPARPGFAGAALLSGHLF